MRTAYSFSKQLPYESEDNLKNRGVKLVQNWYLGVAATFYTIIYEGSVGTLHCCSFVCFGDHGRRMGDNFLYSKFFLLHAAA